MTIYCMALRAIWCQCNICYLEIQRQNNGVIVRENSCPPIQTSFSCFLWCLSSCNRESPTIGLPLLCLVPGVLVWAPLFSPLQFWSLTIKAPHQDPIVHYHKNPGITWEVATKPTKPLAASGLWEWSGIISIGFWNKFDDGCTQNTKIPKPTDQRSSIPHLALVYVNSFTPLIPKTIKSLVCSTRKQYLHVNQT